MSDKTPKKTTRKATKKRTPKQPAATAKSFDYSGMWQPMSGTGWGSANYYDAFDSQPAPTPGDLMTAFSDTVYACTTLIASSLSEIDITLVCETAAGQQAPQTGTKLFRRGRRKAVELHELHDHPALTLLRRPNPSMSWADLIGTTSTYLEVFGRAFWLITDDPFGKPGRIDVLPTQLVVTERDDLGRVTGYQVGEREHNDDEPTYRPEQVIAFRYHEYLDPAQEGISPARAVWLKLQLSRKELSSWDAIVGQMAHPSVMFSPKDPNVPLSPEATERFMKEYQSRHARGQQGGALFNNEAVDMNVLTFPPKDQAGLALQATLKTSILNAYHIPQTVLDQQDANFAGAKCGERSYQLFCLKPRLSYLLERITHGVVRRFDDRLFLDHDDFVEQDEQQDLLNRQAAVAAYTAGVVTKNEARAVLDLPGDPAGNSYNTAPAPSLPGLDLGGQDEQAKSKALDPAKKYDKYPLAPVVDVLQKWFGKQKQFVLDTAVSKAFMPGRSKAWVALDQFTDEMAHDLYPAVKAYYDTAAKALIGQLGLTDDVWQVVTPKLDESIRKVTLQFAASTNRTTSLALDDARSKLRDELAAGITSGDNIRELTQRVQGVFDAASDERAWLIADTERTRAIGAAEIVTAKASGAAKAKVWLCDSMACDRCKALNGVARGLDEPFLIDPSAGHYSVTQAPPCHPGCRCALQFQVTED